MRSRLCTTLLIVAAALATQAATWAYEPPTDEELASWWGGLSREERFGQLRLLDRVEHETPSIDVPQFAVTVTKDRVVADPLGPVVVEVGHLGWEFLLSPIEAPYEPTGRTWFEGLLLGAAAGLVSGAVLFALAR